MKAKYTEEQLNIINAAESKILVNASAGTGKTFTLIGAAMKVITTKPKSKVAVFTLTKAAAEELKERFPVLPYFVGTIHSFALREIYKMEEEGLIIAELMTDAQVKKLLLNAYVHLYPITRGYQKELNDIYRFMTDREYLIDVNLTSRYEKVINYYKQRKKELGLYDFTDAPEYYFLKAREIGYVDEYTHLFVDEVQDIDYWEYRIVSSFLGDVLAIGDPRQNIYQFRNSITGVFDKLEKIGYNLYILTKNFRSYQEILDYSGSWLEAERGFGGKICGEELLEKNPLILCRYNYQVSNLLDLFDKVQTIHSYKGLEYDDVVLIDFTEDSEENKNIMFVGKTRARNNLSVVSYNQAIKKGRRIKYGY